MTEILPYSGSNIWQFLSSKVNLIIAYNLSVTWLTFVGSCIGSWSHYCDWKGWASWWWTWSYFCCIVTSYIIMPRDRYANISRLDIQWLWDLSWTGLQPNREVLSIQPFYLWVYWVIYIFIMNIINNILKLSNKSMIHKHK